MSEFINNAANTLANHNGGQGFMGTKMPTLPQWFGRILGGQSAQGWHDTKGMDSIRSFGDQLSGGSRPLMNSGSDDPS